MHLDYDDDYIDNWDATVITILFDLTNDIILHKFRILNKMPKGLICHLLVQTPFQPSSKNWLEQIASILVPTDDQIIEYIIFLHNLVNWTKEFL